MGKKRHFKGNNSSEDRKRRKEAAEKWKSTRGDENQRQDGWTTTVTDNARFQAFYKAQHFVEDGEDWNKFLECLRAPLPACFRINPDYTFAQDLREQLLCFMGEKLVVDGVEIDAVEQMPWYPNQFGYKLGTDRRSIRKLPALSQLHKWMIQHTANGNITRQEAVSMVPPIALDVHPHHKCLDMCAAPGSKTSQLLEIVNRSLESPLDQQGLVVANDADTDRAYMLVHQCKRINSPLLVVTTHKGQNFPTIQDIDSPVKAEFFDRVLCDVPCSGDGTLRKNPAIWGRWNVAMATSLYPLQLMIANRGYQQLKPGGLMVYSTCSMSPYEDEAVVAELLRQHKDLELVDARQFLPKFKVRPGLTNWLVLDDYPCVKQEIRDKRAAVKKASGATEEEGKTETAEATESTAAETTNVEETAAAAATETKKDFSHVKDEALRACLEMGFIHFPTAADVPENLNWKFRPMLFPPSAEENAWMQLEKCLRCVPQDEDTGGFFVATLRKKVMTSTTTAAETTGESGANNTLSAEEEAQAAAAAALSEGGNAPQKRRDDHKNTVANRGIVEYVPWDQTTFDRMKEFYQFDDKLCVENFFIREDLALKNRAKQNNNPTTMSKTIYYIPTSAKKLVEGDVRCQLKVVTSGIKVFEKKTLPSGEVDYRLLQEGINSLIPHIQGRKVSVGIQDFCNILGGGLVSYSTLSATTIQQLQQTTPGVIICVYHYQPEDFVAPVATNQANMEVEGEVEGNEGDEPEDEQEVAVVKAENEEEEESTKPAATATNSTTQEEEVVLPEITLGHRVAAPREGSYEFHVICWKGKSSTINVMAGKIDIDCLKHQLAALNVLRPKQSAKRLGVPIKTEENTTTVAEEVCV